MCVCGGGGGGGGGGIKQLCCSRVELCARVTSQGEPLEMPAATLQAANCQLCWTTAGRGQVGTCIPITVKGHVSQYSRYRCEHWRANRRFPEITGKDNLTVFSYSGVVKSPECARQRRRADLRQF